MMLMWGVRPAYLRTPCVPKYAPCMKMLRCAVFFLLQPKIIHEAPSRCLTRVHYAPRRPRHLGYKRVVRPAFILTSFTPFLSLYSLSLSLNLLKSPRSLRNHPITRRKAPSVRRLWEKEFFGLRLCPRRTWFSSKPPSFVKGDYFKKWSVVRVTSLSGQCIVTFILLGEWIVAFNLHIDMKYFI